MNIYHGVDGKEYIGIDSLLGEGTWDKSQEHEDRKLLPVFLVLPKGSDIYDWGEHRGRGSGWRSRGRVRLSEAAAAKRFRAGNERQGGDGRRSWK